MEQYDYIIVGAGSAGSVLAYRLGERAQVLVVEAGGRDWQPWIHVPIGYGKSFYDAGVNWKYLTEPEPELAGRRLYWPRGKVVGGSSAINAMVYFRGHPSDFDDWAAAGAEGWSAADVAPYFQRMERWSGGADAYRGGDGPLGVADVSAEIHPLCARFFAAAEAAGFNRAPDYNGASPEGVFPYQITTRGGIRASTAREYLRPALRKGVRLVTRAHVTGLVWEGDRVTGLRYQRGGTTHEARAGEVILAAGAVNSPQILQLAGIGPGALLQRHGIALRADLPVGAYLQDHVGLDIHYRAKVPTLNQVLRPWSGRLRVGLDYALRRRGPLALSVNQAGGLVRSKPGLALPDLQLYFTPVSYTRAPPGKRPMISPDPFPGFMLGFNGSRPTSRGSVRIASIDPFAPPEIRSGAFSTPEDVATAVAAIPLLRRIAAEAPLAEIIAREDDPGTEVTAPEAIETWLREGVSSVFHASCTCRMGRNPTSSVVSPRLKVHGVPGLRVVDASVFPNVTSGNTNAPTIMVAERAADLILEDRP